MESKLLFHPGTKVQLKHFYVKPTHALLLIGPVGSGKKTVAVEIASNILKIDQGIALEAYPYFFHLLPVDNKEISIEQIRNLINKLKLKTPGRQEVRRVVLIESAGFMSTEGQNALLKMLEEPHSDTVFILTATDKSLLPTIISRAQRIHIRPVPLKDCFTYYRSKYSNKTLESNWLLSQGLAGLLDALLNEINDHPLKQAIEQAKKILRQQPYERLVTVDEIAKDRQNLELFLEAMGKVLGALHHQALRQRRLKYADSITAARRGILDLQSALEKNVSPKLINLKLIVGLKI